MCVLFGRFEYTKSKGSIDSAPDESAGVSRSMPSASKPRCVVLYQYMFMLTQITKTVSGKAGISTFTVIHVALLIREVVGDGILVHDTAKEGLHVAYIILVSVSMML